MEASAPSSEIAFELPTMIRVYKDGGVERLLGNLTVPPSTHPTTHVQSKDVTISAAVSARLYLPKISHTGAKLPLLIYFHGGAFCIESAFSPGYHNYLNSLVAEANVVAVSVDYRLAPEHPLPIAFDDSWAAVKWVASHSDADGGGAEPWLKDHADLRRVFFAGDSAGATLAHQMALRVGVAQEEQPIGITLQGIVLFHPYFCGEESIPGEDNSTHEIVKALWGMTHPGGSGCDNPLINPKKDANLQRLGCSKVLVTVAENDFLKHRGKYYKELLEGSGWRGAAELIESEREGHVFFLLNPDSPNALPLLKRVAAFLNEV